MAMKQEVLLMNGNKSEGGRSFSHPRPPDIMALQELPATMVHNRGAKEHLFPDYNFIGARRSHAEYVGLFVKKNIDAKLVDLGDDHHPEQLPAVVAELTSSSHSLPSSSKRGRKIWVASVHLEPFADGSHTRRGQMAILIAKAASAGVAAILVAGDTNMRVAEDKVMENMSTMSGGLALQDLWKLSGSSIETKYTWNTRNNTSTGGYFNQFYGGDTREYIARYDRVYFKAFTEHVSSVDGEACSPSNPITTTQFDLIANIPLGSSKKHFLSDHFGIHTVFRLSWQAPQTRNRSQKTS
jgi:hypothetical protein